MSNTEAPTSQATKDALESKQAQTGLDEVQLKFLTLVYQHYAMYSEVLSKETAEETYGMPPEQYEELFHDKLVQLALAERGVIDRRQLGISKGDAKWADKHGLTPMQLVVANTMMDMNDTRSNKKKLQDLSISTQLYSTWLKDKVFHEYMTKLGENTLKENQHEAMLSLMDRVRSGDSKALSLYYEMTGLYTPHTSSGTADVEAQDFKALLVKLLEILNEEIDDFELAARISERIKGLVSAQTLANQLMDTSPIEKPKVRSMKEITSEGEVHRT